MALTKSIINSLYGPVGSSGHRGVTGTSGPRGVTGTSGTSGTSGMGCSTIKPSSPIYSSSFNIHLISDDIESDYYINDILFKNTSNINTIEIKLNIDESEIKKYDPKDCFKNITHVFETIFSNNRKDILIQHLIEVKFIECKIHWRKDEGGYLTIDLILENIESSKIENNIDIKSVRRDIKLSKII